MEIPISIQRNVEEIRELYQESPAVAGLYANCVENTLNTTLTHRADGTTFVITGDIRAMWLRDSAAQVRPLLFFAGRDEKVAELVEGVVRLQMRQILTDPYANAFNDGSTGKGHQGDRTAMKPELWERKYEVDSLCYPVQLAYLLWKATGRTEYFDESFVKACKTILSVFRTEQHHREQSPYRFERLEIEPHCSWEYETLKEGGLGTPVAYTGMTWSGFRPSDDACRYGYLVPSNMFAVVVLRYLGEIAREILRMPELAEEALRLAQEIDGGIREYGTVVHPEFGKIYAYETDGLGHFNLMDDANVPSLMAIPYFGYAGAEDPVYQNTRRMILSKENPFYFEGAAARGIGSPHTPDRYIWHIALAVQAITSGDPAEQSRLLETLISTHAGTGMMHESFDCDDPSKYTRPWFSWANSMYAELIMALQGRYVPGSPLERRAGGNET